MTFISSYSLDKLNSVRFVIAMPCYNEIIALPILIKKLSLRLNSYDVGLILDDSPIENRNKMRSLTIDVSGKYKSLVLFHNSDKKIGRGSVMRRGLQSCKTYFLNLQYFIECDANGSHQVPDIAKIRDSQSKADLIIGSRYLPKSQIIGWSMQRRIFSRLLNFIITKVLRIPVREITNGRRRYSPQSIDYKLKVKQLSNGLTYLSEQILIIHTKSLSILESSIIFIDRVSSKSTFTYKEIFNSIKGISLLFIYKKRLNA